MDLQSIYHKHSPRLNHLQAVHQNAPTSEPAHQKGSHPRTCGEREFFIDNILVRIHLIIQMIWWTGLAPWESEFPFPGSLTPTFLCGQGDVGRHAKSRDHTEIGDDAKGGDVHKSGDDAKRGGGEDH